MKRVFKWIGTLAVVLVVLLVALAIAVPLLFDINDQKDRIAAIVERETGRALTIEGDLELTLFPWLGVNTGAMSLAQADGFDPATPFASFASANVSVRLLPLLLRRELEVGRVTLRGLQVSLERTADGRENWADLLRDSDDAPAAAPDTPRTDDGFDLDQLEVAGITLSGARIAFRDAQAGTSYTIEDLDLETGPLRLGEPFDLSLDARVYSGVPQWRGEIGFTGRVDYLHAERSVEMAVRRFTATLEGGALPVDRLRASLDARVRGDLARETWRVEGLSVELVARGGRLPDRDHPMNLTVAGIDADLSAQTAALREARFDGLGVRASLDADGMRVIDAPSFTGRVSVDAFSPREVLARLGHEGLLPETRDPTALTHARFAAGFAASRDAVSLTGLDARVDASRVGGHFAVTDLESQALRFELEVDQVDLDRYLPPETPEAAEVPAAALDAIEIPVETIRGLDVDGGLRVARLRAFGLTSEDVRVTARARGGLLRVHPASARLYGGTYAGDISVDVRGDVPRVSMDERLTGVQSGLLFEDLFQQSRITGTADLNASLAGTGHTVGAIRQTLQGQVGFSFRDGAVQGFDLWHLIRDARAVYRREERPSRPEGDPQTPFGALSGTGTVQNGVMTNEDLRAQLPFMAVAGRGRLDLVRAEVDYRLDVTVQRVPGVDGETDEAELGGQTIPFHVSGPMNEPSYRVDLAGILRDQLQERVDDARERLERELLERLRRGIR